MDQVQTQQSLRENVRQQMLAMMRQMNFEYSTRLLSENQLAAKFQVSRTTIRSVLLELEKEGKIFRRHGSGTYVNPQALEVETTIYPLVNMYDLISKNGYQPRMQVLSATKMPAGDRGTKLNLYPFDSVIEIRSIYWADDMPCMYCIDCVDKRRFTDVHWSEIEFYDGSFYDFIRQNAAVDIVWDIITIAGAHSGQMPELQKCFQLSENEIKPLVRMKITNFDAQNRPALLGDIYIDTDKIHLHIVRDLTKL